MKLRIYEPVTELKSKECKVLSYFMTVLQIRITNFLQNKIDTDHLIRIPASVEDIRHYAEFESDQEVWDAIDNIFRFSFEKDKEYKDGSGGFYSCGIIASVIKNTDTGDMEVELMPSGLFVASLTCGARYLSGDNAKLRHDDIDIDQFEFEDDICK